MVPQLDRAAKGNRPSLGRALHGTFKWYFWCFGTLLFIYSAAKITGPLMLKAVRP